jgi:hypothetical protein
MGICGAFWRETKLMAGNYPFSRRHRGPARRFARFRFVPSAPRKVGMAWARRMDESPNPSENEKPGARLGRISPPGCKKQRPGAESGTAGDALTADTLHSNSIPVRAGTGRQPGQPGQVPAQSTRESSTHNASGRCIFSKSCVWRGVSPECIRETLRNDIMFVNQ